MFRNRHLWVANLANYSIKILFPLVYVNQDCNAYVWYGLNISFRNWFLDYHTEFPDGTVICVDHLWALIDKIQSDKTDFTAGYHLSSEHLEVEGSDR